MSKRYKTSIRRVREHAGFTVAQAACYLGLTEKAMKAVERVDTPPTIQQLEALSDLYCVQLVEMLEGPDGTSPQYTFKGSVLKKQALDGIAQFHRIAKNYVKLRVLLTPEVATKIENKGRLTAEQIATAIVGKSPR